MKNTFFYKKILVFSVYLFSSLCIISCKDTTDAKNSSLDFGASIVTAKVSESQTACFEKGFSDLDSCANAKNFSSARTKARIALDSQKAFLENCSEILGAIKCNEILINSYFFKEK